MIGRAIAFGIRLMYGSPHCETVSRQTVSRHMGNNQFSCYIPR